MKRILIVLLAALLFPLTVMASPASAHISTCTSAAYNPEKLPSVRALIAKGRWTCSTVSHHEYVSSNLTVQYWQERSWMPDGWASIKKTRTTSARLTGTSYITVPCVNPPARKYRLVHELYMVGAHGVTEKKSYSYGTKIIC